MKVLLPFIRYPPFERERVVRIAPASLPDPGSVSANAPICSPVASFGRNWRFCPSVPHILMNCAHRERCAMYDVLVAAHARAISSTEIAT